MLDNGKISNRQFSILIILFTIGTTTLIVPTVLSDPAKQDSWLASFVGICFGLLLIVIYKMLAGRYPDLTLAQYCEKILGKWLGKSLSLLFFVFYLLLTSCLLRIIGDLITTHILAETPIQAVIGLFVLTVILAVRYGLETFSRSSEMLFPYVLLFFLLLSLFLLPQVESNRILPILENGINPILEGVYHILALPFLELFIFLMIAPYVKTPAKIGKNMLISVLIGGFVVTLVTLLSTMVIGYELTARLNFPTFVLAQKIDIGNFIQRIEVISGAFIFISIFVKITVTFYSMVLSLAQTLELKNYQILTFPLGAIALLLSICLWPNIIYFRTYSKEVWTPICIIFGLFFPLLLLAVDMIKAKFSKKK